MTTVTGSEDVSTSGDQSRTRLLLNEIRVHGLHGVYDEERETGNEFSIDVELEGDFTKAIETDRIDDSVDIDHVATLVRDINQQNQFHLIESFADAIGRALLLRFPILSRVVVRVTKLTLVRLESVRSSTAEVAVHRR
ncbi:dihydroneopterin aldolase [Candidatus Bipolaricaulota bacterium]|nr:dihydroneopterin aldolase [Candidatus Bipolaricaulota bacterium]